MRCVLFLCSKTKVSIWVKLRVRVGEMNTVEPIRNLNLILDIENYLREKNKRDYVLFMFGLYSGLRISDM